MKIQEFREKIKHCSREDVEKIASELYKMIPKSKKESDAVIAGTNVTGSVKTKKNETVDMDRNSLYTELEAVFAKVLSTSDMKYRALNIIMETVNNYETGKVTVKDSTLSGYRKECIIRELCETMLIISILLFEPMDAVNYYRKHDKESNREVTLYRILDTVSSFGDDKLWIEVYEDGLKRKIKPRESLVNTYNELKNKFTES